MNSFRRQPAFGVEGRHAAGAGGGDRLAVVVVGHVAGREYAFDARVRAERLRPLDVALLGELDLALEEARVRRVADGQEHAAGRQLAIGRRRCVLLSRTPVTPSLSLPMHFVERLVPLHLDLRIGECPLLHDHAGPQLVAAMDHVHLRRVLREIRRLFDGRVAAADHDQRLVAKPRQRTVAHGTGAHAAILVRLFRRQAEIIRPGARWR